MSLQGFSVRRVVYLLLLRFWGHQSNWIKAPLLWHLLKALSPNSVTLGVRASRWMWRGGNNLFYNSGFLSFLFLSENFISASLFVYQTTPSVFVFLLYFSFPTLFALYERFTLFPEPFCWIFHFCKQDFDFPRTFCSLKIFF